MAESRSPAEQRAGDVEYGFNGAGVERPEPWQGVDPGADSLLVDRLRRQVAERVGGGVAGEAGELCIKGPQIVLGYLNRPTETAETFIKGWLHTGDIAKVDEDGFCYILDRKKDMVIVSGFNVYPNEIEAILVEHPDVFEAAVIGVPDPERTEVIKAFVILANNFAASAHLEEELGQFVKKRLSAHAYPRLIEFVTELPKTPSGKIQRFLLRNQEINKQQAKTA